MMIVAPNSLVRQEEGAQGEEEAPTGPTQSGVSDARNRRRHGWWCGAPIHRRGRGGYGPVLSSHDMNGGSYRKKTEVVKGYFCRV